MWKILVLVLVFVVSAQQAPILVSVKEKNPSDSVSGGYPEVVWRAIISDVQGTVIKRRTEKDTLIDTLLGTNNLFTDYEILPNVEYLYSVATLTSTGQTAFSNEVVFITSNIDIEAQFKKMRFNIRDVSQSGTYQKQFSISYIPNLSIGFEISRYSLQDGDTIVVDTLFCHDQNVIDSLIKKSDTNYSLFFRLLDPPMLPLHSYTFTFTAVFDTLSKYLGESNEFCISGFQDVYEIIDLSSNKVAESITKLVDFPINMYADSIEMGELVNEVRYEHFHWGNYLFIREIDSSLTVLDVSSKKSPRVLSILTSDFAKRSNYYVFEDKFISIGDMTHDSLFYSLSIVTARFNGLDFIDFDTLELVDTLSHDHHINYVNQFDGAFLKWRKTSTRINNSNIAIISRFNAYEGDMFESRTQYTSLFEVKFITSVDEKITWSNSVYPKLMDGLSERIFRFYSKIDELDGVLLINEAGMWENRKTIINFVQKDSAVNIMDNETEGINFKQIFYKRLKIIDSIIIPNSILSKTVGTYVNSEKKMIYTISKDRLSIYSFEIGESSPVLSCEKRQQGINQVFVTQNRVFLTNFKEGEYLVEGIQPSGRVCFTKRVHSTNSGVDLTQIAKGPLFIKVSDLEGSVVSVGKFIVK